ADSVGRLHQNRAAFADFANDFRIDRLVATVLAIGVAGVDMDQRGSGLVTPRRRFADLDRLLRNYRPVAILLHPAIERDGDDNLVAFEHPLPPRSDGGAMSIAALRVCPLLTGQWRDYRSGKLPCQHP